MTRGKMYVCITVMIAAIALIDADRKPKRDNPITKNYKCRRNGCCDQHEWCRFWASIGECNANPDYMKPNCQISCRTCPKKGKDSNRTDSRDKKQFSCDPGPLKDEEQKAILNEHNRLRASLAKGREINSHGRTMPQAANMRQLVWNCSLQRAAQESINRCELQHSADLSEKSENVGFFAETKLPQDRINNAGVEIAGNWWAELKKYYPDNPSNEVNDYVLRSGVVAHFIAMAWAETTDIGCGKCITQKNGMTYVYILCQYYPKGVWKRKKIYEVGKPCSKCPSGTRCTAQKLCA